MHQPEVRTFVFISKYCHTHQNRLVCLQKHQSWCNNPPLKGLQLTLDESTTIVLSVQHTAICFNADTDSSGFCHWPPCSDSEEDFSEPGDDSDFDEVNSPPTARPKVCCQLFLIL